jgi:hypothetical protein
MVGFDDSLANFNCQLVNMCFKYHSESTQSIHSSKGDQVVLQVVAHACMSKTAAVCPGPLYNIHKFGISSYQEILATQWDI